MKVGTVPTNLFLMGLFLDESGSESEYSQIEENIYGQTGYSVRWG